MKKRLIIIGIIVVVAGLIVWGIIAASKKAPVPTIKAMRGDITRQVLVTGNTKPSQSVDLSFERTGKVSAVYAKVGDQVKIGQALVQMDSSDLMAQLNQSKAALAAQEAQLDALKKGTRQEEINIAEAAVASDEIAVANAKNTLLEAINGAYTAVDDAARSKSDAVFINARTQNPQLAFTSTDSQYVSDLESKKKLMEQNLVSWKSAIDGLNSSSDLVAAGDLAMNRLNEVKVFLDELSLALNSAIITPDVTTATLSTWKTNTSTARTSVNTASSTLSTSLSGLRTALSALAVEENNLALKKAGSTPQQIAAQQALVDQAKAAVHAIQIQLDKTVLRSPINGVITKQDAKLGQIVTVTTSAVANSSFLSVISLKKLEIEAYVPEVSVGTLAIGQQVDITFDAFPGEKFNGKIIEIDPAETVLDGVVNYQIKASFDNDDERVRSGLTANLAISTAVKKDVILLPQYAILQNDRGTFVRMTQNGETKELPVELGIRGVDGNVEIVSGVSEGEEVDNVGIKSN